MFELLLLDMVQKQAAALAVAYAVIREQAAMLADVDADFMALQNDIDAMDVLLDDMEADLTAAGV